MTTMPTTENSTADSSTRETMRSLIKHHAGTGLEFREDRPVPSTGPREVRIKVSKVGICGTDRHIWEWDEWASNRIPVGIITGHEFVGVIDKVGAAVTKYKIGQRTSHLQLTAPSEWYRSIHRNSVVYRI